MSTPEINDTDYLRTLSTYMRVEGDIDLADKILHLADETDRITIESADLLEWGEVDHPDFPHRRRLQLLEDITKYKDDMAEVRPLVTAFFTRNTNTETEVSPS